MELKKKTKNKKLYKHQNYQLRYPFRTDKSVFKELKLYTVIYRSTFLSPK